MAAALVALSLVVALLAVLVVSLLRSHAAILRQLHELGADPLAGGATAADRAAGRAGADRRDASPVNPAPGVAPPRESGGAHDIVGTAPDGATTTVALGGRDHPTLLAFLTSGCGTCLEFWGALADPEARSLAGDDTRVVIVTRGEERESTSEVARLAPADLTTVMSTAAWEDHEVPVAPYFILVDGATGDVAGEGAASTWEQLTGLLGRAVADRAESEARDARAGRRGRPGSAGRAGWSTREADTDQVLLDAGILPGDPSLYDAQGRTEPEPGERP